MGTVHDINRDSALNPVKYERPLHRSNTGHCYHRFGRAVPKLQPVGMLAGLAMPPPNAPVPAPDRGRHWRITDVGHRSAAYPAGIQRDAHLTAQ